MRTAVVYDGAADGGATPDTEGVLEAVDGVVLALQALDYSAYPVAVKRPLDRLMTRLAGVELVFNLCEGLEGRAEGEPRVAALLELAGPPVTGASSDTLALCRRKDRVNALLAARGVRVPEWLLVPDEPESADVARQLTSWSAFPAIVKPAGEDGSVGIDETSVVEDALELRAAVARCRGDALVQAFMPGREFNVGIVGDVVLPVAEIEFAGEQRVVSYAAKWEPGSVADRSTPAVCPARISTDLHAELVDLARRSWEAVGGRGYGRVDLRTDEAGVAHVLEVNPNPDLAPSAGLARMARVGGWQYEALVRRIVEVAL